jgi:sugar lactone lactonase YvrE
MLKRTIISVVAAGALAFAAPAANAAINTVAGTGVFGFSGDGGLATAAQLSIPADVSVTSDGGYLIADWPNNRIRKVSASGVITTVAGTGSAGFSGDGGKATSAELNHPLGVAALPDGGFLIADGRNRRIRRVTNKGVISTVAGNGGRGATGDGGPATSASLGSPVEVNPTSDGGFLIAAAGRFSSNVRIVNSAGVIKRLAGTDVRGYSGDRGPAVQAELDYPASAIESATGTYLIADSNNGAIREVDRSGTIRTIAGGPSLGLPGEDPANELQHPNDLALTGNGALVVSDSGSDVIHSIAAGGTGAIARIAGTGTAGFGGDGGPPLHARFRIPSGIDVTETGQVLVADEDNFRVRGF